MERETGVGERKIERETGTGERQREIGRETGVGERERDTGEKEKKLQTQKIHGILSCASIRLPSKSHYSPKPEAEVKNDLFSTRTQPELKTCCYFALISYITIFVTK